LVSLGCESIDEVSTPLESCVGGLDKGDDGHADPFGAKAAGQARAGRMPDVSQVAQPAHGRQPIQDGDFVLANDKIAVVIEDGGLSDGYGRFGGEILAIDQVGEDGLPLGKSRFVETLMGLGLQMPNPSSVGVVSDGSDGGEAVVRVIGKLEVIPFLDGPFSKLFKSDYDLVVGYDFVLKPGWEKLLIRTNVINHNPDPVDFGIEKDSKDELYGFFQTNHNQLVLPNLGFADPAGSTAWVGFTGHDWSFAWRSAAGDLLFGLEISGFSLFHAPGFIAEGCAITTSDRVEVIAGGPYYDGLREAIRRVDDEVAWRAVDGTVVDADDQAIAGAWVHALDGDDLYLSRTKTGPDGGFTIHVPPGQTAQLIATSRGHVHEGADVEPNDDSATLKMEPHAELHITAEDLDSAVALPVRMQTIASGGHTNYPASFGVEQEKGGRLHQHFAMSGEATLIVPPGEHRVIVSRGYEYELLDETVTVAAGETAEIEAKLEHSVDSTGVMCADFHIHSQQSADSHDPVELKVKSAIADGLDIPCSSEHEWVVDFGPVVKKLGLEEWAFGMPSEELTTFRWGHFGVVPVVPRPGSYNNGAIDWVGLTPAQTFAKIDELDEQPALIVNHPRSGLGGFFSSTLLDPDTGKPGNTDLWSDNFDAVEVFNDSDFDENRSDSVRDWFNLLNLGMRVFAVGNSDSHHIRTSPVGYPRTCFDFGHDDPTKLSAEAVRDALIAGRSTISGGLLMTVVGPGGKGPGQNVSGGSKLEFTVTVESPSWIDAADLEVFVDGKKIATETLLPLGNTTSNRYVNQVQVSLEAGSWVVFHARGKSDLAPLHPGRMAFAASNPIFAE